MAMTQLQKLELNKRVDKIFHAPSKIPHAASCDSNRNKKRYLLRFSCMKLSTSPQSGLGGERFEMLFALPFSTLYF